MMHFQLMHESLARFSEDFASFLYGLNMNAFCVDFPEGPLTESFKRMREKEEREGAAMGQGHGQQGMQGQNMDGMTGMGNGNGMATTVKQEREGFDGETTFMFVSLSLPYLQLLPYDDRLLTIASLAVPQDHRYYFLCR